MPSLRTNLGREVLTMVDNTCAYCGAATVVIIMITTTMATITAQHVVLE